MAELNDTEMFLLLYGRHVDVHLYRHQHGIPTKLYKIGWNTFPNNARMSSRTDLNLGEIVYISIIFHIPVSWLNLLNG